MTYTNADKAKHGQSAQNSLENILDFFKEKGYLANVSINYRVGKPSFSQQQFYAPFLIEFNDSTKWALFTTTSMRTDRIKGQQWDAMNLKEISQQVTSVYLVYPDGLDSKERNKFIKQGEKYTKHEEYSAIDAIVSQDQISNLIEEYSLQNKSVGQIKDIQGNNFESRVARLLSYSENLMKWKTNSNIAEGLHYDAFKKIVDCFNLDKSKTKSIEATADKSTIGKLPSKGNPKTDVLVEVFNEDGSSFFLTISCKRSSEKNVSVHQYTAESFSNVLDPENESLKSLLNDFQAAGSLSGLGESKCSQLTEEIKPYVRDLTFWVLGGHNGEGDPETQWANYILTYDNNEGDIAIHRIEEYYNLLMNEGKASNFGTPFSWTYPSKKRGKSIQLKCKIIK